METNIDFCKMKVVIIAGGKGTRIASVAADIPKSMIPIAGKPVVEYQIELAKRYGFTDILFIVGHLGEQIETYFGDGSRWGVTISYFHEQEPLGTSGALPLLVNQLTDEFWVFYGDTMDVANLQNQKTIDVKDWIKRTIDNKDSVTKYQEETRKQINEKFIDLNQYMYNLTNQKI